MSTNRGLALPAVTTYTHSSRLSSPAPPTMDTAAREEADAAIRSALHTADNAIVAADNAEARAEQAAAIAAAPVDSLAAQLRRLEDSSVSAWASVRQSRERDERSLQAQQ